MKEYEIIKAFYGDKRARRSGVPYINHIDEGLVILDRIGETLRAKRAYCLHPIVQDDDGLFSGIELLIRKEVNPWVLTLAMEYRNVANRGLNCYQVDNPDMIYLSPLVEVNSMLIADKVQNRKDFEIYHLGTHPKSIELDRYFRNWLRALEVTEAEYQQLIEGL